MAFQEKFILSYLLQENTIQAILHKDEANKFKAGYGVGVIPSDVIILIGREKNPKYIVAFGHIYRRFSYSYFFTLNCLVILISIFSIWIL